MSNSKCLNTHTALNSCNTSIFNNIFLHKALSMDTILSDNSCNLALFSQILYH